MQAHSGAQPPPHIEPSQTSPSGEHRLPSLGGAVGHSWAQPPGPHPLLPLLGPELLPVLEPPLEVLLEPLLVPLPLAGPVRPSPSMVAVFPPHAGATRAAADRSKARGTSVPGRRIARGAERNAYQSRSAPARRKRRAMDAGCGCQGGPP
jgi:hypothetical protein